MALTPLKASATEDLGLLRTVSIFSLLLLPITPNNGILVALTNSLIFLILLSKRLPKRIKTNGKARKPAKIVIFVPFTFGPIGPCPRFFAGSITVISD
ncbi:hypothetical protein D3C87_1745720 [compost metagenome]